MKKPFRVSGEAGLSGTAMVRVRNVLEFLIPIAVLILSSLGINWLDLDRRIAHRLYNPDIGWTYGNEIWVQFFYQFGYLLAVGVALAALAVLAWSFFRPRLRRHNRLALFLLLLLALGPGLVVNGVFKPGFGRPRPRQVVEFGGKHSFHQALSPGFDVNGHSFPCGHATMGFFWIGLFVYWRKTHRWQSMGCLAAGIVQGGLMGAGRMLQGAHWFSDVLWSAGFVYLTAIFLYRLKWFRPQPVPATATECPKQIEIFAGSPIAAPNPVQASLDASSEHSRRPAVLNKKILGA
jgi:membrane-associated PAP2 superfamily phosphatase